MKSFLDSIRRPEKKDTLRIKIIKSSLIFLFGIILGLLSKWLDNLAIDDTVWWCNIIEKLDLGNFFSDIAIWLLLALIISIYSKSPIRASINVFLFFLGMTISYHIYTIIFSGFNPTNYMMIWYGLTFFSPLLAFIAWYAKSKNKISIIINSLIILVMLSSCFSIGMWYFDMRGIFYTITFIVSLVILYKDLKIISISFIIGFLLSFFIRLPLISN